MLRGLQLRLEAMLEDERLTDVVLILAGRRFPCHRVMLASWSGFFQSMFGGEWREAQQVFLPFPIPSFSCSSTDLDLLGHSHYMHTCHAHVVLPVQ